MKITSIAIAISTSIILLNFIFQSCESGSENVESEDSSSNSIPSYSTPTYTIPENEYVVELSLEQEDAFDALNELQMGTDEMNRIYSTFAGVTQPCYPPDSSFTLSQKEFLIAMNYFVNENCKYKTREERESLANAVVLVQEEYSILHCQDNPTQIKNIDGLPMYGIWVLPNLLGRRDLLIEW